MTIKNKITYSAIAMGIGIFAMLFISSSSISELNDSAKDIETIGTKLTQNQTIIAKHERFMGEMCRAMVNNKQFGGGTDATQCTLGKWWYSFKKEEEYNKLPQSLKTKFKAMEISHVKIHAIARDYKLAGKNERTIKNITITAPNEFENVISALEGYSEYLLKNKKEITTHNEELVIMVDTQLIILAVIIVVLFIISLIVNRNIISDLKQLENATLELKNTGSSSSRIEINKDDEISVISQNINDYLNGIEKGIKEDARFIEDTQRVMNRVENGWFSQHIEADTKNPSLIKLKDTVNHALQNLKDRFISMNTILEQYVNLDYRNKLNLTGIEKDGVFDTLIYDINKLRQAINDMLVENKENGLTLDKSSDILLKNVDTLNRNSNSAAAALEETAAALEEITSNIATNTDNVVRMSGFTNKLTSSATEGLTLAKQTTTAMNEIDNQVQSINEAITVIDKIAFQTNILSLNAAVEAATAGEAGKGFAVVAQEVRNLAARSAEAANEIKALVETATNKANEGKNISDRMIEGYNRLNNNITNTIDLIRDIESASKEQQQGIEQINDAVTSLDQQTQQIATIASQTHSVAIQTDTIAKLIVSNANSKEFIGKNEVKAKTLDEDNLNKTVLDIKKPNFKEDKSKNIPSKNEDKEEWTSF